MKTPNFMQHTPHRFPDSEYYALKAKIAKNDGIRPVLIALLKNRIRGKKCNTLNIA